MMTFNLVLILICKRGTWEKRMQAGFCEIMSQYDTFYGVF